MKFAHVLLHLDRTIRELRLAGGDELASLTLLEVVRRDLVEKDHPERATCAMSYFCKVGPELEL